MRARHVLRAAVASWGDSSAVVGGAPEPRQLQRHHAGLVPRSVGGQRGSDVTGACSLLQRHLQTARAQHTDARAAPWRVRPLDICKRPTQPPRPELPRGLAKLSVPERAPAWQTAHCKWKMQPLHRDRLRLVSIRNVSNAVQPAIQKCAPPPSQWKGARGLRWPGNSARSTFLGQCLPAFKQRGAPHYSTALTMSSTTFFASPKTIMVLSM